MNSQKSFPQLLKTVLKIIGTLVKAIYTGPLGIILFIASGYMAYEQVRQISRFLEYGVFPTTYILAQLCIVAFALGTSLLFLRITFSRKLARISYKPVLTVMAFSLIMATVCGIVDDEYKSDFKTLYYPPYIMEWPTQTVSETNSCDYTQDVIYLSGHFTVSTNGFRQKNCLEFKKTDQLTDSYKVEIHYRGKQAEMYLNNNRWEMEDSGRYMDNINIWPMDYDYEVSPQDRAYMYKHRVNLEYSEPLVIEKIIIYTAYPEKFDTSEIWFN